MKKIGILGSTGSIGTQTLDIVREYSDKFTVTGISVGRNLEKAIEIIKEFRPKIVVARSEEDKNYLIDLFQNIVILSGDRGLLELATFDKNNSNITLVNALVGSVGLIPTIEAIKIKRNIALANKETLVIAGEIVMSLARENGVTIFPIDSEHSAIYQALVGENKKHIKSGCSQSENIHFLVVGYVHFTLLFHLTYYYSSSLSNFINNR